MTPDAAKAAEFFQRARVVAAAGDFDGAIEMFLEGLSIVPDDVAAHAELRELSLKRKAGGGSGLGMFEKLSLRIAFMMAFDPRQRMLTAEKLLAYDPLNVNWIVGVALHAKPAGCAATAQWLERIIRAAGG
jgi:tetratricopeptide (TPR) repeat protein